MPSVDQSLRDLPVEEADDRDRILYFLNRELGSVVRKMLRFLNTSWGESVDVTENTVVQLSDEYVRADASDAPVLVLLLPSAEAILGVRMLTLKRLNGGGNGVTWVTQGDDLVDGASTGTLTTQYELVRFRPREGGYDIV